MIHCTSAARHHKSIVYKIAPKRKQRYCTISNRQISPGTPFYANAIYLFYYRGYPTKSCSTELRTKNNAKITNWHIHPTYVTILKKNIKLHTFLFHVLNKFTPTRIRSNHYYYNSNTIHTIRSPFFYDFSCYVHNNTSYFNTTTTS